MILSELLATKQQTTDVFVRGAWRMRKVEDRFVKCLCLAAHPRVASYLTACPSDELVPCVFDDFGRVEMARGLWLLTAADVCATDWQLLATRAQNKTAPGVPEAVLVSA